MTFDIKGGTGQFHCDTCPEAIDTGEDNFTDALIAARRKGWKTYKGPDKQYAHACPACVEDYINDQRKRNG